MQTTPDEYDELLDCRLAMLGLNLDATNSDTFNEIVRRCRRRAEDRRERGGGPKERMN